jgi:hypothetical protein
LDAPSKTEFSGVEMTDRKGVLTQPYLMARYAYLDSSSPIHRGVLIVRNMLGRTLNPPPAAFAPLSPSLHPDLTTRERVSLQTKPDACNACHGTINPLGFTLEEFDAIGRRRTKENGKPIDTKGSYRQKDGKLVTFKDSDDLSDYLANSDEAHTAFVERLFVYLVKQPPKAYSPTVTDELKGEFEKGGYSIRKLMVDIATSVAGRGGAR